MATRDTSLYYPGIFVGSFCGGVYHRLICDPIRVEIPKGFIQLQLRRTRVGFYSYSALATDKYPPFSLEPDDKYPADLTIEYPEKLSRGLVLIKWWLLAIPHYIVLAFIQGGAGEGRGGLTTILAIFAAIALLFTGKYPEDIFKLVVGMNRWTYRVAAYASLMTDEYPPFRLWDE